jgi:hypothetical protein
MVRKLMPLLVTVAMVVAVLIPGIAVAAQAASSEIQLERQATLVGGVATDEIIVEFTYRYFGQGGNVTANASQTQPAPFGTVEGTGTPAPVTCDGQHHHDGITVFTSSFPGWQVGPATAAVSIAAQSGTAVDSGIIRIREP